MSHKTYELAVMLALPSITIGQTICDTINISNDKSHNVSVLMPLCSRKLAAMRVGIQNVQVLLSKLTCRLALIARTWISTPIVSLYHDTIFHSFLVGHDARAGLLAGTKLGSDTDNDISSKSIVTMLYALRSKPLLFTLSCGAIWKSGWKVNSRAPEVVMKEAVR